MSSELICCDKFASAVLYLLVCNLGYTILHKSVNRCVASVAQLAMMSSLIFPDS